MSERRLGARSRRASSAGRWARLLLVLPVLAACGQRVDPAEFPPVDDLREELAVGQAAAPADHGGSTRCVVAARRRGATFVPAGGRLLFHAELPANGALRFRVRRCGGAAANLLVWIATDAVGRVRHELRPGPALQALRLPAGGGPARLELAATEGAAGGGLLVEELALGARRRRAPVAPLETPPARPHLLVYLIDALRRDALGCYGNPLPVSPQLDRLAAEGTVFEDAIAQGSWTRPAVASLFTGLTPMAHGVLTKKDALSPAAETMAERLRGAGYRTLGLVTNGNVSGKLGFRQGFERMRQLLSGPLHSAAGTNREMLRWLDETAADPRPFFAYLHVVEPHGPYSPPPGYRARFAAGVPLAMGSRESLQALKRGASPTDATVQAARALYDAEVAAVDDAFGQLRAGLEARGLWRNTVVVVLADHGEEFSEHGGWEHGGTLHAETIDIPLLVRVPGMGAGRRVATLAQQVDVLPTLLELAGQRPPPDLAGRSLLPVIAGGELQASPGLSFQRLGGFATGAVAAGTEAAVTTTAFRLVIRREVGGQVTRRLYDRRRDPREQRDVHAELPIATAFLESVLRWRARPDRSLARPAGRLDPEVVEQLRALGYAQ